MSRILKYWVCLLAPLTLLLSCVKERTETEVPTGRTIHYRATVTEGTDTRATLNNNNQYIFQEGDRLFVSNTDSGKEGWLSGVLTLVSGAGERTAVFEGDLTLDTGNHDTGKEDFYLANATLSATLVSTADRIHNVSGALTGYPNDEYATTFAEAVAKFSHFTASSNFEARSFSLTQHSVFLNNTITLENSVAAGTSVSVVLYNDYGGNSQDVLMNVTRPVDNSHQVVFWSAIPETTLSNAKLSVTCNETSYLLIIKGGDLDANHYYSITKTAAFVPEADLFTIKARQATEITFNYTTGLEYSSDRLNWTSYTVPLSMGADDVLYFRATGNSYRNNGPLFTVTSETNVYIYGDIMALMSGASTIPANSAFEGTFKNATWIDIPDGKDLVLSATTLTTGCYKEMFSGSSITKTPIFPNSSIVLGESSCNSMFKGCTGLESASAITVENVGKNGCYQMFYGCNHLSSVSFTVLSFSPIAAGTNHNGCREMFFNCTALTSASGITLAATTMYDACYYSMFEGCTLLASAPALPAATLAKECYRQMFKSCAALTPAPALTCQSLADGCYRAMFFGCTSLTTAPVLPAATLVSNCYYDMFNGCTSLRLVTCMATSGINVSGSTTNWLNGVPNTAQDHGTFIYSRSVTVGTDWPRAVNGIPTNWICHSGFIPGFPGTPFDEEVEF